MAIKLSDHIIIKRGSRPNPLSKYEVYDLNSNNNAIPYPIQSDINKNSLMLNKYKKMFKINLGFKFEPAIKGDLLLSSSCDIGNVVILDLEKAFIDDKFFNIKTSPNLSKKYLQYWLLKNKKEISELGYGTTFKVLYLEPFKKYIDKIFLPDLEEQQQIINIIEPKEDLFLKYHKVVDITTLETFTSSWANLINIIEPFEKIECKYKAKIDYILKIGDFKILNPFSTKYFLRDFFNVEIGQTPSTKNKSYWKDGENFWINSGALTNNLVLLNATNKITQNAVKSKNLKKSNKYSTFISIMEPSINKISLSGISSYFNQSIANIEPINKNDYGFIFFELRRNIYKLSSLSTGTAQKSINKSDLLNFKINRPIDDNLLFFKLSKLLINHHNIIFHCKKIINLITSLLII